MHLVRDLLDKKIVDRNGREMGRVDRIIIERRADGPPRVSALCVGPSALGHRLHPLIGRLVEAIEHVFAVDTDRPVFIEFGKVLNVEKDIKVDLALGETAAGIVEQKMRQWVARLPGSQ